MSQSTCPECGAVWTDSRTCTDDFHQMLFWEAEFPEYGVVHHLMVLSYHLQHPSLYSVEGLAGAKDLLHQFVAEDKPPQEVRQQIRSSVASDNRQYKITARPDSQGAYTFPVQWTMTAADVVAGGSDHYCDNTRAWARAIYDDLKASNNLDMKPY